MRTSTPSPDRAVFSNPQVPITDLPSVEEVVWQPLDRRFMPRLVLGRLIRVGLLVAAALGIGFVVDADGVDWLPSEARVAGWIALALWALRSLVWPVVSVPCRGYAVRDKDILYKAGVLWRSTVVVPFNRVQHAVTGSAPLDRRFGLASLTVFTAGGGGGDVTINGLAEDMAEQLRVHIVNKLRRDVGAESGPAD